MSLRCSACKLNTVERSDALSNKTCFHRPGVEVQLNTDGDIPSRIDYLD